MPNFISVALLVLDMLEGVPHGFYRSGNSAIRSDDPENPSLKENMERIGCTVCKIFAFKLYCDLETGV